LKFSWFSGKSYVADLFYQELAEYKVNVNAIAPAFVDTPLNDVFTKEQIQSVVDKISLGRKACRRIWRMLLRFWRRMTLPLLTGKSLMSMVEV
jgi:NAD(P)-dependent dehydrogenase (short-subunit alcohol dehydrogenase family)